MGYSSEQFIEEKINQQTKEYENDIIQYRERLFEAHFTDRSSGRGTNTRTGTSSRNKRKAVTG